MTVASTLVARLPLSHEAGTGDLEELLERTAAGDRRAFRELYDRTVSRLLAVALAICRRRDAAEEATQEAYLRIWQRARLFDPTRGRALPWMAQIVRHLALDRRPPWVSSVGAESESVPELAAATNTFAGYDLTRCLGQLDVNQRRAIVLAFLYGYTHEELAAVMGVPVGTAKSWVRRGLVKLRTLLEQ